MDISLLLKMFFFISILTQTETSHEEVGNWEPSKSSSCGLNSPEIRHPFQIQGGLHPQHGGGLPGFKLSCERNRAIMNFPDYGDLEVKSIFYDTKRLHLSDPKNCVHEVFLNLNLSQTPFRYYHLLRQYKYISCSTKIPSTLVQFVPCMSSSESTRGYVYTVESSLVVPVYCKTMKIVGIPFAYSPYLSDNSFGLELTWDSTETIKAWRIQTTLRASVKMMALILIFGIILYAKIPRCCMELSGKTTKDEYGEVEVDVISQGEYEALNIPPRKDDEIEP